jgi:DedD protein
MARPISDEELQLKKRARRRLVGAIVLVTAVAVILPMVLDSEPKPVSQNVDIQIPSPESGEFKPKSAASAGKVESSPIKGMPPVSTKADAPDVTAKAETSGAPKADAPSAIVDPASASAGKHGDTADVDSKSSAAPAAKPTSKPAAEQKTAASKEPLKAAAKDSASASGSYVVQVAALADAARVKQLQKQMSGAGVKTYTEVISTKAGEITRVRAGPYATREAAESARSQLKKAGLDGKVVPK